MEKKYIIALDQGTTSSRAVIFDRDQKVVRIAQREYTQYYPKEGWVEHDPMEIYATQYGVLVDAMLLAGISAEEVAAIGITNQRETTIVWEKATGRPVYNAIVWQCRRTAPLCEQLEAEGLGDSIRASTGLLIDAYFSATKLAWILDQILDGRARAERGELLFGTVDSWLMWKLSGGEIHATDYTNASRTMMFNIHTLQWDEKILARLGIPRRMLPEVRPSASVFGYAHVDGVEIPIAGVAGDQQAALFGQCCWEEGQVKNTYGTGCFLLYNTGTRPVESKNGLVTTIAASADGSLRYALEGSVFTGGAVVQWLRDEMRFIGESADSEYYARKVPDTGGVYMVPAFTGLGAPQWDMYARGLLIGITRGTRREHIIRAALESIAYQSADLLEAVSADAGRAIDELSVDGGASANGFLMQFQSDILGIPVCRPEVYESTAQGAAYLAGLTSGFWTPDELLAARKIAVRYTPQMDGVKREKCRRGWKRAVSRSLQWAKEDAEG
ncbi:MAG TPA: glycerol kinase GlpK [Candidatus Faecivivens stercoravium]|uniref:Glycerol kinase n=1 Tax=Candidatus Faecivivens stercoravium TaxID=2840803 RepID=A0A9D1J476_9FIRM|nr:glycerol kinase GlpK [Candidatus Faecivivens stercoravium]